MSAETEARQIVAAFLAALTKRDLPRAHGYLADGAVMIFPGDRHNRSLEDVVAGTAQRYRKVAKDIEHWDTCRQGDDVVVYCFGTLYGEWLDGGPFAGVRFIDRFLVREGRIVLQQVWNDAAYVKPMINDRPAIAAQ